MYDPNKSNSAGGAAYAPGINPQFANQPNWQAGANTFKNSPYGQNPSPLGKSLLAANKPTKGPPFVVFSQSTYRPPSGDPRTDQAYKDAESRGREGLTSGRYATQDAMDAQSKGYSVVVSPEAAQSIERPQENTISQYAAYLNKALKKGPQAYEEAMRLVRQALLEPRAPGALTGPDLSLVREHANRGRMMSATLSPPGEQAPVEVVNVGPSGQPASAPQTGQQQASQLEWFDRQQSQRKPMYQRLRAQNAQQVLHSDNGLAGKRARLIGLGYSPAEADAMLADQYREQQNQEQRNKQQSAASILFNKRAHLIGLGYSPSEADAMIGNVPK